MCGSSNVAVNGAKPQADTLGMEDRFISNFPAYGTPSFPRNIC